MSGDTVVLGVGPGYWGPGAWVGEEGRAVMDTIYMYDNNTCMDSKHLSR